MQWSLRGKQCTPSNCRVGYWCYCYGWGAWRWNVYAHIWSPFTVSFDVILRYLERSFIQWRYGEPVIRRAVPLALGIISVSNPQISVMDTLSKLSHDHDADVAQGAIFGLGLIGAGTQLTMYCCRTNAPKQVLTTPVLLVCCEHLPSTTTRNPTTSSWWESHKVFYTWVRVLLLLVLSTTTATSCLRPLSVDYWLYCLLPQISRTVWRIYSPFCNANLL